MKHLLVTNDFPPKVGGIQTYLWELWRRLPPADTTVLTTKRRGAAAFDAEQPFRVVRDRARVLLPTRSLAKRIDRLADEVGADLVVLDPAAPVGLLGPRLERPYGVVVHGAEVSVPGRLPLAAAASSAGPAGRVDRDRRRRVPGERGASGGEGRRTHRRRTARGRHRAVRAPQRRGAGGRPAPLRARPRRSRRARRESAGAPQGVRHPPRGGRGAGCRGTRNCGSSWPGRAASAVVSDVSPTPTTAPPRSSNGFPTTISRPSTAAPTSS